MSFINTQTTDKVNAYIDYLQRVAKFSKLFSESVKPFLQYRTAENLFCKAFDAKNLSRGDIAYDAIKDGFGIGIKTFLISGDTKSEKVAEFNAQSAMLRRLKGKDKLFKLAELRNERILFADRTCEVNKRIYHCIGRDTGVLKIFETNYDLIDLESLVLISENETSLSFKDKYNEYNFNISKSTIFKKFIIPKDSIIIPVKIHEDPLEYLSELNTDIKNNNSIIEIIEETVKDAKDYVIKNNYDESETYNISKEEKEKKKVEKSEDYVILPLYSPLFKRLKKEPFVPEKSGLNQWNAGGRKRDDGEVYISIPKEIHAKRPNFFPDRDVQFKLILPTGKYLTTKVCQDGNKALMTNPNNALAEWLLRGLLQLRQGQILKYERLEQVGTDSVKIIKNSTNQYRIEFTEIGSYEKFINL